ncbi:MAG: hypothetical protein JO287_12800 [Pseudonocardiales bacterium]|nr:hypothetical protein [Pseudonocardiales bacterium]
MLAAVQTEYVATRDRIRRGDYVTRQSVLAELETRAARFAEYQPALIPGLAQTAAYARAMLELPGLGSLKAHRTKSSPGWPPVAFAGRTCSRAFVDVFDALRVAAVTGDDAVGLIRGLR